MCYNTPKKVDYANQKQESPWEVTPGAFLSLRLIVAAVSVQPFAEIMDYYSGYDRNKESGNHANHPLPLSGIGCDNISILTR